MTEGEDEGTRNLRLNDESIGSVSTRTITMPHDQNQHGIKIKTETIAMIIFTNDLDIMDHEGGGCQILEIFKRQT